MLVRTVNGKKQIWNGRNEYFTSKSTGEQIRLTARVVESAFSDDELADFGLERADVADEPPVGKENDPATQRFIPGPGGKLKQVFDYIDRPQPVKRPLPEEFLHAFGYSLADLKAELDKLP